MILFNLFHLPLFLSPYHTYSRESALVEYLTFSPTFCSLRRPCYNTHHVCT